MAYVEKLHGKELDRIMGNEVSITEHKGHVTFQLLDQTKSAFHAQFAREKFITFYQKIATDLQKRTFQRDVTVLQHLRNPPLPLHILSDDPRTVTLMGSFLSLGRFEEALKGTSSRPAQGVYPARRDSVKTSSVSVQKDQKPEKEQTCPICLDTLVKSETEILSKCKHAFCRGCLKTAFDIKPACPICGVLYGKLKGTQPEGGTMHVMRSPSSLPGYGGYGTITIYYDIPSGIQGEEHPNPGQTYTGTRRTAYLPDSKEGNKVLKLLAQAFDQRLVFTIGRSSTTGHNNAVTWNDIHHKTSQHGGPTYYGYPDPDYLQRVQGELKVKGIY
ncbi:probable E3 ubiquitin-protein ligase DTX3 [Chanos chanos]|uniref:E3 ubiquitin-protein ligase n=1 Tax=Chanos chanos TaxID=29144 RepID=A0A6J2WM00_CHACN|nr:probable E3 ubiquitin-protein ligase DTX3 [Chanos chanos]